MRTALDYFEDLKLVKTSIGCLTNFSVLDISREELSKEKDFYVIIYNVLESYDYSVSLLEYCLKMIMNTSRNNLCFKNYSSPKFILKLIFFELHLHESLYYCHAVNKNCEGFGLGRFSFNDFCEMCQGI